MATLQTAIENYTERTGLISSYSDGTSGNNPVYTAILKMAYPEYQVQYEALEALIRPGAAMVLRTPENSYSQEKIDNVIGHIYLLSQNPNSTYAKLWLRLLEETKPIYKWQNSKKHRWYEPYFCRYPGAICNLWMVLGRKTNFYYRLAWAIGLVLSAVSMKRGKHQEAVYLPKLLIESVKGKKLPWYWNLAIRIFNSRFKKVYDGDMAKVMADYFQTKAHPIVIAYMRG